MDKKFKKLCKTVRKCGLMAKKNQKTVKTIIKEDGTPVTETDMKISKTLSDFISKNWPDCNCVSEEVKQNVIRKDAPYTFVFDPIDGTSSYSQGMPSWSIGVGVLDKDRKPCAAVLYSPSMDILLTSSFDDKDVYLNGKKLTAFKHKDVPEHMTVGSNILRNVDLFEYTGKIRSLGSSLLHIAGLIVWPKIDCALSSKCYVWDICASHILASKLGFTAKYLNGKDFVYSDDILVERKPIESTFVMGNSNCVEWVCNNFKERN